MPKLRILTGIVVGTCLIWSAPARADVVSDWNVVTLLYVSGDPSATPPVPLGRGGPPGLLDIALVHLAMHDAVQAIEGTFRPYRFPHGNRGVGSGGVGKGEEPGAVNWTPLLAAPPYPDYVSGANGLTGAFTRMLQLFFRTDRMDFSVKTTRPEVANPERFYRRFSEAAEEVVDARIILGIHFRAADVEARRLGNRVAHWTFTRILERIKGPTIITTIADAVSPGGVRCLPWPSPPHCCSFAP